MKKNSYCIHHLNTILENYPGNEDELIARFALKEAEKTFNKKIIIKK